MPRYFIAFNIHRIIDYITKRCLSFQGKDNNEICMPSFTNETSINTLLIIEPIS